MYGLLGYRQRYNYFKICNLRVQKNQNIEKIIFTVVQMSPKKSLEMHRLLLIKNRASVDILTVGHLQNIFLEHDLYYYPNVFWH